LTCVGLGRYLVTSSADKNVHTILKEVEEKARNKNVEYNQEEEIKGEIDRIERKMQPREFPNRS
jgi:tRNA(Met) C34 N-acetyltransferase TmcA